MRKTQLGSSLDTKVGSKLNEPRKANVEMIILEHGTGIAHRGQVGGSLSLQLDR
jgi:hypothetical protein